jgi:hypothetical protein
MQRFCDDVLPFPAVPSEMLAHSHLLDQSERYIGLSTRSEIHRLLNRASSINVDQIAAM